MENKAHAMAAGLFVLALAAMLVGLAAWLTRDSAVRDPYEISTRESLTGLQPQAPVRFRGVDVGKVTSITFDPQQQGHVLVRLEVDRGAPVSSETFASLGFLGVTGLGFIQLDDTGKPAPPLVAGAGGVPRIPLRPGFLGQLHSRSDALLGQLDHFLARANQVLSDENQHRLASSLDRLGDAAGQVGRLAQRLNRAVDQRLDPVLSEAQTTLRAVQKASDEVGGAAAGLERTAQRLGQPGGTLDQLGQGAQALTQAVDTVNAVTLPGIGRAAEESARAARALDRAAAALSDNPQSLIFGNGPVAPGPGEPGFAAPGASR